MLPHCSHWRLAVNEAPEREARLLAFADRAPHEPYIAQVSPEGIVDNEGNKVTSVNDGQAVDQAQNATREQVADTIDGESGEQKETAKRLTAAEVLKEALEIQGKVVTLHTTMLQLHAEAKKMMNAKDYNDWVVLERFFAGELSKIDGMVERAKLLDGWERGSTPPSEFFAQLKAKIYNAKKGEPEWEQESAYKEAIGTFISSTKGKTRAGLDDPTIPDITDSDMWRGNGIAASDKQQAIDHINGLFPFQEMLQQLKSELDTFKQAIEKTKAEDTIKQVQEDVLKRTTPDAHIEAKGWFQSIKEDLDIEFYSPKEIFEAFTQVKEALEETWRQKRQIKSSGLAKQIGSIAKYLPHASDADRILRGNQEKKNDEVKNQYKEFLNAPSQQPNFPDTLGPGGELERNAHDPNRARAVLEYSADRGWLYDITDHFADKTLLGRFHIPDLMPKEWEKKERDSFFFGLVFANQAGTNKQAEAGKNFVHSRTKEGEFIDALTAALNDKDLWFAKGIMERAFEKGLTGEISPWMATTVMRKMREDKEFRRIVPISWLDEIGKIAAYSPAPTLGKIKFEKDAIRDGARRTAGRDLDSTAELGNFGRVVQDIRDEILSKDASLAPTSPDETKRKDQEKNLDRLIAQVLATQTVKLSNGKIVTIFSEKYDDYNSGFGGEQGQSKIGDLDEDFYRNRSEIMLSDKNMIEQILLPTGDGDFADKTRAGHFLSRAIEVLLEFDELIKASTDAQEKRELTRAKTRFRDTFGQKIEAWLLTRLDSSRASTLATQTLGKSTVLSGNTVPRQGEYAVLALLKMRIIGLKNVRESYLKGWQGKAFAERVLQQCVDPTLNPADEELRREAQAILSLNPRKSTPERPQQGGAAGRGGARTQQPA